METQNLYVGRKVNFAKSFLSFNCVTDSRGKCFDDLCLVYQFIPKNGIWYSKNPVLVCTKQLYLECVWLSIRKLLYQKKIR